MNGLALYQREHGLDDQGLADLLSERADRPLTAEQAAKLRRRPKPARWALEALGLETREAEREEEAERPSFREHDEPPPPERPERPEKAAGRDLEAIPDLDFASIRAALRTAYAMAGKGAAYAAGSTSADPVRKLKAAEVERAFDLHADRCAEAWVDLARRDAKVAKVLHGLTAGGAWGSVILIHLSLLGSVLIASGKVKLPEGTLPMAPGFDADDGVPQAQAA